MISITAKHSVFVSMLLLAYSYKHQCTTKHRLTDLLIWLTLSLIKFVNIYSNMLCHVY